MINSKTIQYPFSNSDLIIKVSYAGSNPEYIGYAAPGTATSAAAWQIRKVTYNGSGDITDVQFAAGVNDYTKVWDDRAGYSYS